MELINKLSAWVERKPIVLLRLRSEFLHHLTESKRGLDRFTIARPHKMFYELKLPTLCLMAIDNEDGGEKCYVGVAASKAAVATFDSRLTIKKLQPLNLNSLSSLKTNLASKAFQSTFESKLKTPYVAVGLTPKLSVAVLRALETNRLNKKALLAAAKHIPRLSPPPLPEWEQLDAIKTAMAAFGLSKSECPWEVETSDDSDSTLALLDRYQAHVFEDYVIQKDAGIVPGFSLIERDITGRAIFVKGGERLEIFTANRGPLEAMLGVDLVYINDSVGSTIMVQYKMLEPARDPESDATDWIYRPDSQFERELGRMKLPPFDGATDDYRLHRDPFFFKFVKRKGDGESHQSFIISRDHLTHLLNDPFFIGPRGGIRISFAALGGLYLRETDLIGLIRSGYIGTHRNESDALQALITEVARGNRALVLAWQRRIEWEQGEAEDLAAEIDSDIHSEPDIPF